jgi:hypothetical protein
VGSDGFQTSLGSAHNFDLLALKNRQLLNQFLVTPKLIPGSRNHLNSLFLF